METVLKVKSLSKFGFFVEGEDKGIYFDRSLLEADRGKFVPGAEIPVTLRVAESGTKYVMGIGQVFPAQVSFNQGQPASNALAQIATPVKAKSETMSKSDWASKDRSMMVGGLSHDAAVLAAASATANVSIQEILSSYEVALKRLVEIRENVK